MQTGMTQMPLGAQKDEFLQERIERAKRRAANSIRVTFKEARDCFIGSTVQLLELSSEQAEVVWVEALEEFKNN